MKFCEAHWDKMKAALEARSLSALISPDGKSAIEKTIQETKQGGVTLDTFDPLMVMHWNIAGNLMQKLGQSAAYLLSCPEGQEDPIDINQIKDPALKAKYIGKKWPLCPICYANITHEFTCRETKCMLARENGWDVCIEWAADAAKNLFDDLMKGTSKQ